METEDEVRMLLRAFRHLKPKEDDTFSIFASDTFLKAWQNLPAQSQQRPSVSFRYSWWSGASSL